MKEKGLLTQSGEKKQRERYLLLFIVSFFGMMIAFLPTMIRNGGIFLYYGDFNSQQMMFYQHANEMVRNGNLGWDWGTDLGANFIGSYSFYLLGSPFFWLTTLFPLSAVKYLMPWMLALKTSVAAITSYAYIRRFVQNRDACFIGAMLYAFSGFQLYNVFFNHFHDVTAFFPLLLLTFEMLTQDKRRGVFALAVALCATVNYFFFVCEVVFVVIYFFIRCTEKDFKMDFKIFGRLCFEAVLGVALACFIFLPACIDTLNNPRVDSRLYGIDMIFYNESVRIPRIIQGFFMMSDMPARVNILRSDNARWASIAGYLPLFSMCGVIAFMRNKKKHWATKLIAVSGIMMCVPWLNSVFVALNSSYYARWFFAPILIMCLMTAKMLEEGADTLKKGFKLVVVMVIIFLGIGMLPTMEDGKAVFGKLPQYVDMYYMQFAVTAILTAVLGIIIYYLPRTKNFSRIVSGVTAAACIITMFAGVNYGAVQDGGHDEYIKYAINGKDNLDMDKLDKASEVNHLYDDNTFYRIDTSENVDNWCMFWGLSSMRTFHSVVPSSIMDFYTTIGQTRDVASRMPTSLYALRSMFSVRYYFDRADNKPASETVNGLNGFDYIGTQNDFNIYENQYWIPMGFTYDYYTDTDTVNNVQDTRRPNVLLEAVVLDDAAKGRYMDILKKYEYNSADVAQDHFEEVCAEKRAASCYYFKESTNGFDAKINLEDDKLLFFSVPYEEGWTATVNGEEVQIDKANYGFMAIRCPAGESDIHFEYKTAGLSAGKKISAAGVGVFIVYMAVSFVYDRKRKPANAAELPEGENTASEPGEVPSEKALEDITAENTEDKQDTDGAENGGEQ
jgi:uncharacterized membrane protein YfhO